MLTWAVVDEERNVIGAFIEKSDADEFAAFIKENMLRMGLAAEFSVVRCKAVEIDVLD